MSEGHSLHIGNELGVCNNACTSSLVICTHVAARCVFITKGSMLQAWVRKTVE